MLKIPAGLGANMRGLHDVKSEHVTNFFAWSETREVVAFISTCNDYNAV